MSFLYDPKLLKDLIKIGQNASDLQYNLEGNDAKEAGSLAVSLLDSLVSDFSQSNIQTASGKEVSPQLKDLSNLDNLLAFLTENAVLFNNAQIAEWQGITKEHKVNNAGLKSYLLQLRKDAYDSKNNLFILLVGKLILQANDKYKLGIEDQKDETKSTEKTDQSKDFDDMVLDTLPKELDLRSPYASNGWQKLFGKDLKDKGTFGTWIDSNIEDLIDEKGVKKVIDKNDLCKIVNYLFLRATKGDPKDLAGKKDALYKVYLEKVKDLSSALSCNISGMDGSDSSKNSGNKSLDKNKELTPEQQKKLQETQESLSASMPFNGQDRTIDLVKIEKFIKLYKSLFTDLGIINVLGDYQSLNTPYSQIVNAINTIRASSGSVNIYRWGNDLYSITNTFASIFKGNNNAKKICPVFFDLVAGMEEIYNVFKVSYLVMNSPKLNSVVDQQLFLIDKYKTDLKAIEFQLEQRLRNI